MMAGYKNMGYRYRRDTPLDGKKELFAKEYLKDFNAAQAAIRAGYSKKRAKVTGCDLLCLPSVSEAISEAMKERMRRLDVDADWVLKRLVAEAQADVADLYDPKTGELLHPSKWPLIWRQGLVTGIKTGRSKKDGDELVFVDEIKQSDRIKRIELIGKHIDIQAFKDRQETELTGDTISDLIDAIKKIPGNNIREVVSNKLKRPESYDSGAD